MSLPPSCVDLLAGRGGGLPVSRLGLGGVPLANRFGRVDESEALDLIEAAYRSGITLYDVAPLYGHGAAEHRVGHVLRTKPRDSYVLATKVGYRLLPAPVEAVEKGGWAATLPFDLVLDHSYDGTMRAVEDSLQRLATGRLDIVHIHDVDHVTHGSRAAAEALFGEAMRGSYRALHELRSQGVIAAIGCGVKYAEWAERFLREADIDTFMLAGSYSLLVQDALDTFFPLCTVRGVALTLGAVFHSGILATGARAGARHDYRPADRDVLERVARIERVCQRYGVPLAAAAIQFPLAHPVVASVVLGMVSKSELEANLEHASWPIPDEFWEVLSAEGVIRGDAPVPAAA